MSINQIRREEAKAGVRLGADDRLTADDQVDKRSVQTICLGTGLRSDEYLGRDVQRQLLGRPVELKATAGLPAGDTPLDGWIRPPSTARTRASSAANARKAGAVGQRVSSSMVHERRRQFASQRGDGRIR
jgi:hypothetical protein